MKEKIIYEYNGSGTGSGKHRVDRSGWQDFTSFNNEIEAENNRNNSAKPFNRGIRKTQA